MISPLKMPVGGGAACVCPLELCLPGNSINHTGINRCLEFLAKNFAEPIQIRDLVRVSGMSRRGFIKAFLKNAGNNPGAFLRHLRLEHAKELLVKDDLDLKQIAKLSGFRSENTFCVAFQRTTGTSPKRYQRRYWLDQLRRYQPGTPAVEGRLFTKSRETHFD